jgi:serine/tyrosine/threonine adenylyltransferase
MKINLENTYSQLPEHFYKNRNPDQVKNPELIKYNFELAEELNIDLENISDEQKAEYFSGNKLFPNSQPIAQVYAGHQFGHFSRRL